MCLSLSHTFVRRQSNVYTIDPASLPSKIWLMHEIRGSRHALKDHRCEMGIAWNEISQSTAKSGIHYPYTKPTVVLENQVKLGSGCHCHCGYIDGSRSGHTTHNPIQHSINHSNEPTTYSSGLPIVAKDIVDPKLDRWPGIADAESSSSSHRNTYGVFAHTCSVSMLSWWI